MSHEKTEFNPSAFRSLSLSLWAYPARAAVPGSLDTAGGFQVTERGAHSRVWTQAITRTDPSGVTITETNHYTELATGLHFLKDGRWTDTRAEFEVVRGVVVAAKGQH